MFLSVATTHRPATDLGFLLHKHPERVHGVEVNFGTAWLFYPQAGEERCEAVLLLDVDPVNLVRGKGRADGLLDQYVNDRPYAATSFLSVAMNKALRTAMVGTCKERPALAEQAIPLEAVVTPLPARGGETLIRRLFEPLGWTVALTPAAAGEGGDRYVTLRLSGEGRLSALLRHLYVLIPVLDDAKHYWVGDAEVEKLLARGEGWLEQHPGRELIARRYLKHRSDLARGVLARLAPELEAEAEAAAEAPQRGGEEALETPLRLNAARLGAVTAALQAAGAKVVADLGCGDGKLLQRLAGERWVSKLIGLDPSPKELERAAKRLKVGEPGGVSGEKVSLLQGSLTYRDPRWAEADAAALVEVIEHLDLDRLPALTRTVFAEARPRSVVVTTPNAEHNALFPALAAGGFRHDDHRFEWTRAEFQAWAEEVAASAGYQVRFEGVGAGHEVHGAPTQMAVFTR